MEPTQAIGIGSREAIWTVIYVAGPILITALALGLLIGVLSGCDFNSRNGLLSFIPKLMAVVAVLLLFGVIGNYLF